MKGIRDYIYRTCSYTVLITLIFYTFIAVGGGAVGDSMPIEKYIYILFFSAIIAFADFIFIIKTLTKPIKILIHFVALLICFLLVFGVFTSVIPFGGTGIAISVAIFVIFYAVICAIVILLRKFVYKLDEQIKKAPKTTKKEEYTPKFK